MAGMPSMSASTNTAPTDRSQAAADKAAATQPTPTVTTATKVTDASSKQAPTVIAPITHNNTVIHVPKSGISMAKKAP